MEGLLLRKNSPPAGGSNSFRPNNPSVRAAFRHALNMDTTALLNKIIAKDDLSSKDAGDFLEALMRGEVSPVQAGSILTALRIKGETTEEILGFVQAMRRNMLPVEAKGAIDIVGTGGDGSGTFNISTTSAFVIAGAGVGVAKHGNRAASSKCGSADVLEVLGVNIQLSPDEAQQVYQRAGMVFLFAPLFHPATKQVVAVRKELKIRTIFNVLGPLVNPASVKRMVLGVPDIAIAKKIAAVACSLNYTHLLVVTGGGMDEISILDKTTVFEIKGKSMKQFTINPAALGFKKASKNALKGGDARENAKIVQEILSGKRGPQRDIVILNSAAAIYVAGAAKSIKEGIARAQHSLDSGAARKVLHRLVEESAKFAKKS